MADKPQYTALKKTEQSVLHYRNHEDCLNWLEDLPHDWNLSNIISVDIQFERHVVTVTKWLDEVEHWHIP